MPGANPLGSLLNDPALLASHWGRSHLVLKGAVDPSAFITSAEIDQRLEASLLKWPYFTVLHHGEQPPVHTYTSTRDVIGQKRSGFPDAEKIRRLMAEGASLKLNQLTDWHRPTRDIRRALEELLPAAVASYLFWTPPEQTAMRPHRDAAHVIAIQLEGRKEWHLYARPEQVVSTAGLDVDSSSPTHTLVLEPGDVLYLPHGWPHDARARDGSSLHLTFTLTEPTPEDLLEALMKRFSAERTDLVHRHHARTLEAKSEEVRAALLEELSGLDTEKWVSLALATMRETVG